MCEKLLGTTFYVTVEISNTHLFVKLALRTYILIALSFFFFQFLPKHLTVYGNYEERR